MPAGAPRWRRSDRIYITGATQTGKTHLARALFASLRPPRLVIDPKDDETATGGVYPDRRQAVTFHDPARLPTAEVARFVPRDPDDLAAYDAVLAQAFARPGLFTWIDEAGVVLPAAGAPRAGRRLVTQGASRGNGLLALHQRPVEVARAVIANAEQVIAFTLYHPDDRAHLAAIAGIPPALLDAEMGNLHPHGFLWYSRRGNTLAVCPRISQ